VKLRIDAGYAERDIRQLAKQDPDAYTSVKDTLQAVRDAGWADALRTKQIKVLRGCVGEVRDMAASFRIIFFWHDERPGVRLLILTRVAPKGMLKQRRLQALITDAEKKRRAWLDETQHQK
jgi:hypothetical protein